MKSVRVWTCLVTMTLLLALILSCESQSDKKNAEIQANDELTADKIPDVVMDALKSKFPDADIQKWEKEDEDDFVLYDIEFKQGDIKFEADIEQDGSIHNWEKEIESANLPEVIKKVIEDEYPDAELVEVMEISTVQDGNDVLEEYELVLRLADEQKIEITLAPNGELLEDAEIIK
jgi:hypothetical protein